MGSQKEPAMLALKLSEKWSFVFPSLSSIFKAKP